jgi:hypothetical protein
MSSKREYGDYLQDISDAIDAAEQFTGLQIRLS